MWSSFKPSICTACLARRAIKLNRRYKTHYAVLGVARTASQKEIRDAYLHLSKKEHPDQNQHAESHDRFVEINEAYNTLNKATSRREYDMSITPSAFRPEHHMKPGGQQPWPQYPGPYRRNPSDGQDNPYKDDPFSQQYYEHYHKQRTYYRPQPSDRPNYKYNEEEIGALDAYLNKVFWAFMAWMAFMFTVRGIMGYQNTSAYHRQTNRLKEQSRENQSDT